MTDLPTYVLERKFNAPVSLVWQSWTDPALLARWYGPGVETIIHLLDVRPGGVWLNEMRWGENSSFQKAAYTVVEPENTLAMLMSNTNAEWEVTSNPKMPDWPRVLLTTVTFEPDGEGTAMRLTWVPHDANDAEIDCFAGAMAGLDKGWGSGMDILADMLAEMQA